MISQRTRFTLAIALTCGIAALSVGSASRPASAAGVVEEATPAPPLGVKVAQFSGSGARVLTFHSPSFGPLVFTATHTGSANFIIELVGKGRHDLLVNEIGSYAGQVVADAVKPGRYRMPVNADGSWTVIVTRPIPGPSAKAVPATFRGHGSKVLRIRARNGLQPIVTAKNRGSSNFIVMLIGYGSLTGSTLLFNEIGNYHGQTLVDAMPPGPYLLAIQSDGDWTIKFTR